MFYADTIGLSKIYEGVLKLREVHGKVWQPSKLLAELAKSNGTFVDWDKRREG
jgi:hypothetical protein